jgi:peptide subunit release factor RF-3
MYQYAAIFIGLTIVVFAVHVIIDTVKDYTTRPTRQKASKAPLVS